MAQGNHSITTPWVAEYHNPAGAPNRPGKDGGSTANPMGNCPRCTKAVSHEDMHDHNIRKHTETDKGLGKAPSFETWAKSHPGYE